MDEGGQLDSLRHAKKRMASACIIKQQPCASPNYPIKQVACLRDSLLKWW